MSITCKLRTVVAALLLVLIAGPAPADQNDPRLDRLFARLQMAQTPAEANLFEQMIWSIWLKSKSDGANILMRQGIEALEAGDHATALESFDAVVEIQPEFAEGWNKRATLYFLMGEYEASIEDIHRTLELEPRHFGAMAGLGLIHDSRGDEEAALRAFEAALQVNPHMQGIVRRAQELRAVLESRRL